MQNYTANKILKKNQGGQKVDNAGDIYQRNKP